MFVGIGVGIGRNRFAQGIFNAYNARVIADGGITEAGNCVNAVSSLLQSASLLLIPSGYKSGKAYAEIPTNGNGDLTWTRASTALRTNSSGLLESMGSGVPRLSYMYGSCPALLLEPQRTNLCLRSEEFDSATWAKNASATITANSTTAPDGNTTADTLTVSASTFSGLYQAISGLSAIYTISVYVKKGTKNWFYFLNTTGTIQAAWFDLNNGIVGTVTSGYTATMTSVGNGWYRCSVSQTTNQLLSYFQFGLSDANNSSLPSSSGTAFIWGAQVEVGSYPTTYIPTTTATATRIADFATTSTSLQSAGILGSVGNTAFYNVTIPQNTNRTGQFCATLTSGLVATNSLGLVLNTASIQVRSWFGGTGQLNYTLTTNPTTLKIALSYVKSTKTIKIFVNGSLATTVSSIDFADYTQLTLHDLNSNTQTTSLFYHQIALFNSALSDSDCIALTT